MTTTADILALHDRICSAGRSLVERKNHDYGAGGEDAFANFRTALAIGVKPEMALLIRVLDKISRLRTFLDKGVLLVDDEKVEDTVVDVINYMVLLLGMIQERKAEDEKLRTTKAAPAPLVFGPPPGFPDGLRTDRPLTWQEQYHGSAPSTCQAAVHSMEQGP